MPKSRGFTLIELVIVIVVLINASLGFFQEHRAENALAALRNMLAPSARVRRDGEIRQVDASTLVPGDILLLEAGDRIPADARVLTAHAAEVAEAAHLIATGTRKPNAALSDKCIFCTDSSIEYSP